MNFFKKYSNSDNADNSGKNITKENADKHILNVLHKMLTERNVIKGDSLYCYKLDMTLTPMAVDLTERLVTIHFFMNSPKWGTELFECVSAMGKNPEQAINTACTSFVFSFIQGLEKMEKCEEPEPLETEFTGKNHKWKAYKSNLVGMGESVAAYVDSPDFYWRLLKDDVIKRLGNQKLCYVKIYVAKNESEIIGECRIDDIKSDELSELVAQSATNWDIQNFASQKMFFFIKQEDNTVTPYPYFGIEGYNSLKEKIKIAMEMFLECDTDEQYDSLIQRMFEKLSDKTLADECYSFIPEICAENAFGEIKYSEMLDIQRGNKPNFHCYKNQLSDYYRIQKAAMSLLSSGVFGDNANKLYSKYIGYSAVGHGVSSITEAGNKLDNVKMSALVFSVSSDFEIR